MIVKAYDDIEVTVPYETMYLKSAKEHAREFLLLVCIELVVSAVNQRLKFEFGGE